MADRVDDAPEAAIARRTFFVLGSVGLLVAALYVGRYIFVTLALAMLLTLLLTPVVSRLERRGLKRLPAVLSVALLAFVLIGLAGWTVAAQVTSLLAELPQHTTSIRATLAEFRDTGTQGPLGRLQKVLDDLETAGSSEPPAPVIRLEPAKPSLYAQVQSVAGPVV